MIGEIVGEAIGGVVRFISEVLVNVVFEVAVRGVGYLICRLFKRDIDSESFTVALAGILFWAGVVLATWSIHARWRELVTAFGT